MHLYNKNREKAASDKHRGIFLFSITGKILACILQNRITEYLVDSVVLKVSAVSEKNRGIEDNYGICHQAAAEKMH